MARIDALAARLPALPSPNNPPVIDVTPIASKDTVESD
jgi:hypothetical protein